MSDVGHVLKSDAHSWCGVILLGTWHFQSIEHAKAAVEKGMRMQPCKRCMRAIEKKARAQ